MSESRFEAELREGAVGFRGRRAEEEVQQEVVLRGGFCWLEAVEAAAAW